MAASLPSYNYSDATTALNYWQIRNEVAKGRDLNEFIKAAETAYKELESSKKGLAGRKYNVVHHQCEELKLKEIRLKNLNYYKHVVDSSDEKLIDSIAAQKYFFSEFESKFEYLKSLIETGENEKFKPLYPKIKNIKWGSSLGDELLQDHLLATAIESHNLEIFKFLIENGANPEHKIRGYNIWEIAALSHCHEILEYYFTNFNGKGLRDEWTPLHYMCEPEGLKFRGRNSIADFEKCLDLIIAHKVDINQKIEKNTALDMLTWEDEKINGPLIEALIKRGVKIVPYIMCQIAFRLPTDYAYAEPYLLSNGDLTIACDSTQKDNFFSIICNYESFEKINFYISSVTSKQYLSDKPEDFLDQLLQFDPMASVMCNQSLSPDQKYSILARLWQIRANFTEGFRKRLAEERAFCQGFYNYLMEKKKCQYGVHLAILREIGWPQSSSPH